MKTLKNLVKTETLNVEELMMVKGAMAVDKGCEGQLACNSYACINLACDTLACKSSACNTGSCNGGTCDTFGCNTGVRILDR